MAKKRGRETARDMIYSMGAVLIAVVIILVITNRSHSHMRSTVDYSSAIASAKLESSWPILIPDQVPDGFEVTQARFEPESYGQPGAMRWYLGFHTMKNQYISLWQSDGPTDAVVSAASNDGSCVGVIHIAGAKWTKCYQAKPLSRALYKIDGDQTIVVSGTTSTRELQEFVELLHPAK